MMEQRQQQQLVQPIILGIVGLGAAAVVARRVATLVEERFRRRRKQEGQQHAAPPAKDRDIILTEAIAGLPLHHVAALVFLQALIRGFLERCRYQKRTTAAQGRADDNKEKEATAAERRALSIGEGIEERELEKVEQHESDHGVRTTLGEANSPPSDFAEVLEQKNRELEEQKKRIRSLELEKENLQKQLAEAAAEKGAELEARDHTIRELRLEKETLWTELQSASSSSLDSTTKELLEKRIQTLEEKKAEEVLGAKQQVVALTLEKDSLRKKLESSLTSLFTLFDEKRDLEERVTNAETEKDEQLRSLWKSMKTMRKQIAVAEKQNSGEMEGLNKTIFALTREKSNMEKQLQSALASLADEQRQRILKANVLEEHAAQLEMRDKMIESLTLRNNDLEKQLEMASSLVGNRKEGQNLCVSMLQAQNDEPVKSGEKLEGIVEEKTRELVNCDNTIATLTLMKENLEAPVCTVGSSSLDETKGASDRAKRRGVERLEDSVSLSLTEPLDVLLQEEDEESEDFDVLDNMIKDLTIEKENLKKQLEEASTSSLEAKKAFEECVKNVEAQKEKEIRALKEKLSAVMEENLGLHEAQGGKSIEENSTLEKEDIEIQLETSSVTSLTSRHQHILLDESARMLEQLRGEVVNLRAQNTRLRREFDTLQDSKEKLLAANDSATASFATLHRRAKELSKTNEELSAEVHKHGIIASNLREELKIKQSTYVAEVHSRIQCHMALMKVKDLVQERCCEDKQLLVDIAQVADEYDSKIRSEFVAGSGLQ